MDGRDPNSGIRRLSTTCACHRRHRTPSSGEIHNYKSALTLRITTVLALTLRISECLNSSIAPILISETLLRIESTVLILLISVIRIKFFGVRILTPRIKIYVLPGTVSLYRTACDFIKSFIYKNLGLRQWCYCFKYQSIP